MERTGFHGITGTNIHWFFNCKMEQKQLKILIVDDDVLITETLKDQLVKLGYEQIKMVHNKEDAFAIIPFWKPHVALLDIRMEDKYDGLEIGARFRDEFKIPFMYVTAHADMDTTNRILKTRPDGYITKPIRINELMVNFSMVVERFREEFGGTMAVKNGYETEYIKLDELVYLKADGNYVEVCLRARKVVIRNSLENIVSELNSDNILRIHRSYAVNKTKIQKHSSTEVMVDGVSLPVSRSFAQEVKARLKGQTLSD